LQAQSQEFARAHDDRRRAQANRTVLLGGSEVTNQDGSLLHGGAGLTNHSDLPIYDLQWSVLLRGEPWPGGFDADDVTSLAAGQDASVSFGGVYIGRDLSPDDVTITVLFRDHSNNWWRRGLHGALADETLTPPRRINGKIVRSVPAAGGSRAAVSQPRPSAE
jgi:hypothetical protein